MKKFQDKRNIVWDFDGVLIDSDVIRTQGFREVLSVFPEEQVESLLRYHKINGGLSRYVKFRYFFEKIRGEKVTDATVFEYSDQFSALMKTRMTGKNILIQDTLDFVQKYHNFFEMHIASGSDGPELRFLCEQLGISRYFKSINGSPTPKIELVKTILAKNKYIKSETLLIGDSINDYEAAKENNIAFFGFNNADLKDIGNGYIFSFSGL